MRYIAAIWEQETGAGMGTFQEPEKGYPFHPSKGRPMGNRAEPLKGDSCQGRQSWNVKHPIRSEDQSGELDGVSCAAG
jgi:hypothetical protein